LDLAIVAEPGWLREDVESCDGVRRTPAIWSICRIDSLSRRLPGLALVLEPGLLGEDAVESCDDEETGTAI
jgi:hypothetical protein